MAEKEQELTPEEKLLKVIQEGDESTDGTAASDVAVSESAVPEPLEPAVAAEPAPVEAAPKRAAPPEPALGMIGTGPVVVGKGNRAPLFGMALLNRILAVVVLVMIGFAVYEIWANLRYPVYESAPLNDPGVATLDQAPDGELTPLDDVLKDWQEQPLFGQKTRPQAATNKVTVVEPTPFEIYARNNLKLIGLSGDEAILSDRKVDKMHFLTVGGTFTVNDVEIKVADITSEHVEVLDGEKKIQIE